MMETLLMPREKVDTKRVALYLTVEAVDFLERLAPSENKRGRYLSDLILRAAQEAGLIAATPPTVEDRIATMERELARLKADVAGQE